jgi:hypothetical protein
MSEEKGRYYCDPEKNTECRKTMCFRKGGPCKRTSNPEYAKKDENGNPITAKRFCVED